MSGGCVKTLFVVMLTAAGLFAGWEDVRGVTAEQRVEVSVRKGKTARGELISASETGIVVRDQGGERSIARDEIWKVRELRVSLHHSQRPPP